MALEEDESYRLPTFNCTLKICLTPIILVVYPKQVIKLVSTGDGFLSSLRADMSLRPECLMAKSVNGVIG